MNARQFAEFWRMQGCSVMETESCFWYAVRPLVYLSLPHHRALRPSSEEVARVFRKRRCAVIRFPVVCSTPVETGVFVCADRNYDFASLEQKARNQTRRGLERCTIEQVDFEFLARCGQSINSDTWIRQGRHVFATDSQWVQYCNAARRTPGFESWGAFVQGRLVAFFVAALVEDHYTVLHQVSASEFLKFYPNNALIYSITKRKLADSEVGCVSYGLKSIENTEGLNRFKYHMGFTLRPMGERILLHPLASPACIATARKAIQWAILKRPSYDFLRKAHASLSFAEPFKNFEDASGDHEDTGATRENSPKDATPLQDLSA